MTPEVRPHLSVVLPLYNEAACLDTSVHEIQAYLDNQRISFEIVLVNDGSTDCTQEICERVAREDRRVRVVSYASNRGKGHAVRQGMLAARGKYVLFTDADLAVPIRFVSPCLESLQNGTPVVLASRHLPDSKLAVRESPIRQFLGEAFRRMAIFGLGLKVTDITCGFKGFTRQAARRVFSQSRIERWGYDAEVIFLAQKYGYRIGELPVEWRHSFDSKVRVGIDTVRTVIEMFKVHYNDLTRRYGAGKMKS